VKLLTIGEFARAAGLTPKAMRLYDELDLLRPATVDGESGYRYYQPAQLERARLIAWLRQLRMPLATIRSVVSLSPEQAAAAVRSFMTSVLAETAHRQRLADLLVDYLSGRDTAMPEISIRYAARTDQGAIRPNNSDAAYASDTLLAVADGVAGPAGERASAAAISALRDCVLPGESLLTALASAVSSADRAVGASASSSGQSGDGESVTTLTAFVRSGSQLALVHIGDTRAYQLRDGELLQITHDHSYVQSLVDSGELSPEEAASHPQAMLLTKALTGTGSAAADVSVHSVSAGDRYLLCSDGLSRVVPSPDIRSALVAAPDPESAVDALIALAHAHGAPDNIACVVADVVTR
jgi:protein phosphatase